MTVGAATAVVSRLIVGWEARDVRAISACFAPDAVWHNMPHLPIKGRDMVAGAVRRFLADMVEVRFDVLHSGEVSTGIIFNERIDTFIRRDGSKLIIPVAGVFEVHNGLIVAWRDYFDAVAVSQPNQ